MAFAAIVVIPFIVLGELGMGFVGQRVGLALAGAAIILLALDTVLPVPASAVLVLLGAELGIAAGTIVGAIGLVLGTWLGLGLGAGVGRLAGTRATRRVEALGWAPAIAVGLLRGVPVLAETSAALAGAAGVTFREVMQVVVPASLVIAFAASVGGRLGGDEPAWLAAATVIVPLLATVPLGVVALRRRPAGTHVNT